MREQAPGVRAQVLRVIERRAAGSHRKPEQQVGERVPGQVLIGEIEESTRLHVAERRLPHAVPLAAELHQVRAARPRRGVGIWNVSEVLAWGLLYS